MERWGWKFTLSFIVSLKVSTISEKLISKAAQVSEDGMELALTGCGSGSSVVHKDSSSTTCATKRSGIEQPQKKKVCFPRKRSVGKMHFSALLLFAVEKGHFFCQASQLGSFSHYWTGTRQFSIMLLTLILQPCFLTMSASREV